MNLRKQITWLVTLSLLLTMVLSACGGAATQEPAAETSESETTEVETTESAASEEETADAETVESGTTEEATTEEATTEEATTEETTAEETASDAELAENVGTMASALNINVLDPSLVMSIEHAIMFNVYETLTLWDPEEGVLPNLATSWESNEDATEWVFHLREGVTFHDGTPFTAEAVKFSYERTISLGSNAYVFVSFDTMEVVDDLTLRVTTKYPAPLDRIVAGGYGMFIMSPTVADKDAEWFAAGNDAGTGAYTIESFEAGARLVMTYNADYWREWQDGQFTTVVFDVVEDPTVREQMLRSGEADMTWNIPFDSHEALNATGEVKAFGAPSFYNGLIHIKQHKAPFDNLLVRQALAYTFPYEDVASGLFGGYGTVAKGAVPRIMWTPETETEIYTQDLETAAALLDEAGYAEGFDAKIMITTGDQDRLQVLQLWQAELAKINVNLTIQEVSLGVWWDEAYNPDTEYDMLIQGMWIGWVSPSEFMCALFHSGWTFLPFTGYDSAEFNGMCEEALSLEATEGAEADRVYQEAEQMLVDEVVAIFFLDMPWNWAHRTDIQGFEPNPLYLDVMFWYDMTRG